MKVLLVVLFREFLVADGRTGVTASRSGNCDLRGEAIAGVILVLVIVESPWIHSKNANIGTILCGLAISYSITNRSRGARHQYRERERVI